MSFVDQIGDIGSEMGRAISMTSGGGADHADEEIVGPLDLFDAMIEEQVWKHSLGAHEVLRAREKLLRLFYGGTFEADAEAIESHFMRPAFVARSRTRAAQADCWGSRSELGWRKALIDICIDLGPREPDAISYDANASAGTAPFVAPLAE